MPSQRQEEASSSSSSSHPSLYDLGQPTSSRRIRHLASLHLRNFRPGSIPSSDDAQELFNVALGVESVAGRVPQLLTEPSQPCVNADWQVDPRRFDEGGSCPSSSRDCEPSSPSLLGRQNFTISAWARNASKAEDGEGAEWSFCWQRVVDLRNLERIPTGVSTLRKARAPDLSDAASSYSSPRLSCGDFLPIHSSLVYGLRSGVHLACLLGSVL